MAKPTAEPTRLQGQVEPAAQVSNPVLTLRAQGAPRDPRRRAYIRAALQQAVYKTYNDGTIYGEIPALRGVLANEATQEECTVELAAALRSWLTARLRYHLAIPVIDGSDLNPPEQPQPERFPIHG